MVDFRLPPPSIVPISDGGLQIEWHRAGKDFEIEFSRWIDPTLLLRLERWGRAGRLTHDLSTVQQLLQQLL